MVAGLKNTKSVNKILQSNSLLIFNNIDINEKLYREAMIKVNRKTFNLIAAANYYIKIITFREDYLLIHIKIIENCMIKITKKSIAYTKLVIKFFKNKLWIESK